MSDGEGVPGTVCPFCAVGCRLDREGDRVVGREGPANPDGRLCRKGLRAFDDTRAVDDGSGAGGRLTRPLVRRDGDLEPVPWAVALDRAAEGLERVAAEHGPDSLAFLGAPRCPTETNYLLQRLARALGTNNVDNRARLCHAGTARVLESRLGWPASTSRAGAADVFLVVGANPAARQPVAFDAAVRPAVNGGATLVHVDPRENETTRLADYHLAPRPGTDALVVSLLCALAVEAGGVDRAFVDGRTAGYGRFRRWLRALDLPADAAAAGVDPERVRAVASAVVDADRVVAMVGRGGDDEATADALVNMCLVTGSFGRPGAGVTVLRGLANEQGAVDAGCVPDRLPGHRPVDDPGARERLADEWGHPVPSTPGLTEHDVVAALGEGVRGALVVGENPAVSKRDADALSAGLADLDALVVQEVEHSETTAHADVVLPAAAGVERAGTVTNMDRQVQRLRRLATPPGDARTDFAILRDLGRRLVGDAFDYASPRAAFAELARVAPPYGGLSYDALADRSRRWPALAAEDGGRGRDPSPLYAGAFDTADGRARFVPVDLADLRGRGRSQDRREAGLELVVSDRAGSFGSDGRSVDRLLTVHPADATTRNVVDGDRVTVSNGDAAVETRARVSDAVRRGTVHLHATVADPLVRRAGDDSTVRLRPAGRDGG